MVKKRGGKRRGAGRPAFKPTDEQRRLVSALAGYGAPQEYICIKIINPQTEKSIDKKSLEKHFRSELDSAMTETDLKMVESLFMQGVGRPAQYDKDGKLIREELKPNVAAAIFWTKARLKWSERVEITTPPGQPIEHKQIGEVTLPDDLSELSEAELAQLYREKVAPTPGAVSKRGPAKSRT
jgi:hypothetical protein